MQDEPPTTRTLTASAAAAVMSTAARAARGRAALRAPIVVLVPLRIAAGTIMAADALVVMRNKCGPGKRSKEIKLN